MKLSSFLLTSIIAVVVYFIVKNLSLETVPSNALITVLVTALLTALFYISQSGRSEGSLKVENKSLETRSKTLEQENSNLKKENIALQEQISKYTHRDTILSNYPFDSQLGIRKHKDTGQAVCPTCILLNPPRISPLQVEDTGWTCNAPNCNFSKANPNWRPPTQANSDYDVLS